MPNKCPQVEIMELKQQIEDMRSANTCKYCGDDLVAHAEAINNAMQMHWDCFKELQQEQKADD